MRWDTCHAEGCDRAILPGSDRNMCPWCRGVFGDDEPRFDRGGEAVSAYREVSHQCQSNVHYGCPLIQCGCLCHRAGMAEPTGEESR